MTTSYLFWILVALMIFWTLGAYNRLVLLRSGWVLALQLLAAQWQAHASAIQLALQSSSSSDATTIEQGVSSGTWLPLVLASRQLQNCIVKLVAKPQAIPSADDLSSIQTAYDVMRNMWISLENLGEDLAGSAVPHHLSLLWQQQASLVEEKCTQYNVRVVAYNRAIEQFPARMLAWVFRFQAAYTV